jgi:putative zinc finger protein/WD40 repeat protein
VRGRSDPHARYRELLAARLDRPLTRAEQRGLVAHVRTCPGCQQTERDYRDQSKQLRALQTPVPPRDLWARTSTALDREVARWPYRYPRAGRGAFGAPRPGPAGAMVTIIAALGVVSALTVMQLAPATRVSTPTGAVKPTPFTVADQSLAFIGAGAADLAVYRTSVSQVCPPTAPDCFEHPILVREPVSISSRIHPRTVALSPNGERLAFVGDDVDRDVIAVVMLPSDRSGPGPQSGQSHGQSQNNRPDETEGAMAGATRGPDSSPPSLAPISTTEPGSSDVPSSNVPASPPDLSPSVTTPPASAVAGLTVLAIIENVQSAGAPPAWSANGEVLAFSAMPSDGSQGPDVYVWQPGDERARAITTDHASFFASWSGRRVVASRIKGLDEALIRGPVNVATVVIDPATLEERRVYGPQMWLPVVDPDRSRAVVWYGTLEHDGLLPLPRHGALYLVDWSSIDPFGPAGDALVAPPPPEPEATPTPVEPAPTDGGNGGGGGGKTDPSASATPDSSGGPDEDKIQKTDRTPTPEPTATSVPDDGAEPDGPVRDGGPVPDILSAVDPDRDPMSDPVLDWQARWSGDGRVLGLWFADALGESWGQLELLAIDPGAHQVGRESLLLGPVFAKRGFTLGLNRVAFVAAPNDGTSDGELRVRTWDGDGVGGTWEQSLEMEGVVPAF